MIELVMFDADGVLFDSTESNTAYYNAIFTSIGEPVMSPEEQKAGVYMSAPQVFELRAAGDIERLKRMRAVARTMDSTRFFKMMRPALELRPFLLSLKRSYRIALATNRSSTVPALIDHLGITGIFDAVASVLDKVRPKPAPDIVELCLNRAGVRPERAVYVGDSETDLLAAEAAGTHFIGVGSRVSHRNQITGIAELPVLLHRQFGESEVKA